MPKSNGSAVPDKRIDTLVAKYRIARDEIAAMEKAHKERLLPWTKAKEAYGNLLLAFLDATHQEMARTALGTVYTSIRSTAPLSDPDMFMDFVRENDLYELLDRKANAVACREYAEQHDGILPPGVKLTSTRTVGVRAP